MRVTLNILLAAVLVCSSAFVHGQSIDEIAESEAKAHYFSQSASRSTHVELDRNYFDVVEQFLEVEVDPSAYYIEGRTIMKYVILEDGKNFVQLDLANELTVNSVNGSSPVSSFTHEDNVLTVYYSSTLQVNSRHSVTVEYEGTPGAGRSFTRDTTDAGRDVIWTLSEPYGAKDWWPCKQDLQDKIEEFDMVVICPDQYKAAANGLKVREELLPGNIRKSWFEHNHPIVAYLVAFSVAEYEELRDTLDYRDSTLNFVNYVYPEYKDEAIQDIKDFHKTLNLFDSLFGEYPFKNELYGHAQFSWSGGMEHQTMSFMRHLKHGLVAHELAHQWFGDKVTCGSWHDLWLNEGFATYATGLTYEMLFDDNSWLEWRQNTLSEIRKNRDGSVYIEDTTDVGRMFSGQLTYNKGAYLLHMLRWKMGDEAFFAAIYDYVNSASLSYGFARTDDLIYYLKLHGGEGIDEFFQDWFYGKGWPTYYLKWYQDEHNMLYIVVDQKQTLPWDGTYFDMDLPVRATGLADKKMLKLAHQHDGQEFKIQLDFEVIDLNFDPDLGIISGVDNEVTEVDYKRELIAYKIYPHPSKGVVKVYASSPNLPVTKMEIYSMTGDLVWRGSADQGLSSEGFSIDISQLDAGVYFLSVQDFYDTSLLRFIAVK